MVVVLCVGYFLVGFSASHVFYFEGECVVLFYLVNKVGESALCAVSWDVEGFSYSWVLRFDGDGCLFHGGV